MRQGFTGYEKDAETGLNFAQARYHSPTQGRFTSVDPENMGADPSIPQSWNGYAYVLNNPLLFVDPTGLIWGYRDGANGQREFAWCAGDTACKGYEPYTQDTYTFGDGRVVWFNQEEGTWGRVEDVRPNDSCLNCQGLIDEMARRGPAMEKMILGATALNLAPAVVGIGAGAVGGGGTTLVLETAAAQVPRALLGTARMNLLNAVRNPNLRKFIEYLYRQNATVGNGSTADAIRFERATGQLLSRIGHSQKGQEAIKGLEKLLRTGKLSGKDQEIARQIIDDLTSALK